MQPLNADRILSKCRRRKPAKPQPQKAAPHHILPAAQVVATLHGVPLDGKPLQLALVGVPAPAPPRPACAHPPPPHSAAVDRTRTPRRPEGLPTRPPAADRPPHRRIPPPPLYPDRSPPPPTHTLPLGVQPDGPATDSGRASGPGTNLGPGPCIGPEIGR